MIPPCAQCGARTAGTPRRPRPFCSRACANASRRRHPPATRRRFEALWREGDRLREIAAKLGLPMGTAASFSASPNCPARYGARAR